MIRIIHTYLYSLHFYLETWYLNTHEDFQHYIQPTIIDTHIILQKPSNKFRHNTSGKSTHHFGVYYFPEFILFIFCLLFVHQYVCVLSFYFHCNISFPFQRVFFLEFRFLMNSSFLNISLTSTQTQTSTMKIFL